MLQYDEHKNAWLNNESEKSNFAAHLIGTGHWFKKSTGVAFLHEREKGKVLSKLEEIEIAKYVRDNNYQLINDIVYTDTEIDSIIHVCTGNLSQD